MYVSCILADKIFVWLFTQSVLTACPWLPLGCVCMSVSFQTLVSATYTNSCRGYLVHVCMIMCFWTAVQTRAPQTDANTRLFKTLIFLQATMQPPSMMTQTTPKTRTSWRSQYLNFFKTLKINFIFLNMISASKTFLILFTNSYPNQLKSHWLYICAKNTPVEKQKLP